MPMIGVPSVDNEGVKVVHDWIRSLQPDAPVAEASLDPKNVEEALALYHQIQTGEIFRNPIAKRPWRTASPIKIPLS